MNKEISDKPTTIIARILKITNKYIDYKMGIAGAIFMAAIVFYINYHGTQNTHGATTAALKQGTYTFFFGGIIMRMSELLVTGIIKRNIALIAACVIPSVIAISLTLGLHSLKGTPKPVLSTIPTVIFVIPSTLIWGFIKRKNFEVQKIK